MERRLGFAAIVGLVLSLLVAGCAQPAPPPAPTKAAPPPTAATPAPAKAAAEPAAAPTKPTPVQPSAAPVPKVVYPKPGKPVTVISPIAAGGPADITGRLVAAELEKEFKTGFPVVNMAGATGQIGLTELYKAEPDGHTLAIAFGSAMLTHLDVDRKAVYTRKDFQTVAQLSTDANVIAVLASSPYKTLKELIDAAKANPGKIKAGAPGVATIPDLGRVGMEDVAGVKFAAVQFDGAAPATTALLGGHVDVIFSAAAPVVPHFQSGAVRVLGILSNEEFKFLPGVKTTAAQGYPVDAPGVYGIITRAGTPMEIVNALSVAIKKALSNPEIQKKFEDVGLTPSYKDPAQYEAFWIEWEKYMMPLIQLAKKQ